MKIVLASSNKHKVQEINDIVKTQGLNVEFILPPEGFDPIEDGDTFEKNSYIRPVAENFAESDRSFDIVYILSIML